MSAIANVVWTLGQVISLKFLTTKTTDLSGWNFHELILLLSFGQLLVYATYILYDHNFRQIQRKIISGDLDRYIVKPINLKFILSFEQLAVAQIIPMLTTIIPLLAYGLSGDDSFSYLGIVGAFIILLLCIAIVYFLSLVLMGFNFYTDSADTLRDLLTMGPMDMIRVPLDLFSGWIKFILTYILPMAFAAYYPVKVMQKESNFFGVVAIELMLLILFITLSKLIWHMGLKRYSGAA